MNSFSLIATLLLLFTVSNLSACSWFGGDDDGKIEADIPKESAEILYSEAKGMVEQGRYTKAISIFEEVERLYPFSNLAPKAQVMTAYSHYKNEDYDKAISVIDNFVKLNPGNSEIDFMYYLKANSYYDRISDVKRDQDITVKAKAAFEEVMRRFPGTDYAKDSKYKIALIRDHLAGKEMEIGRFYLNDKKYIAALNRFKTVFEEYEDTPQIEESLYRLVETNMILGLRGEAQKYGSVLGHNYPNGIWYERAYSLLNGGKVRNFGKTEEGWFDGWFSSDDDDSTPTRELHSADDEEKLERLFEKEIE